MMKHYILYHTATGKIESVLKLSEISKAKMLANNTGIALVEGSVADVNRYQVNVSVTPHTVESKPPAVVDVTEHVRIVRTRKLKLSDWTQGADSPLSSSKKAEWATYRQALRDLPDSADNWVTIDNIVWPNQPS